MPPTTLRLALALMALALSGCPATASQPDTHTLKVPDAFDPVGLCPDKMDLAVVYLHRIEVDKRVLQGWFVHEAIVEDDKDQLFTKAERDTNDIMVKVIDRDTALAHGASPSDEPLWIYTAPDTPPCKATPGRFWGHRTGDGAIYTDLAREVTPACDLKGDEGWMLALRQPEAPTQCLWDVERQPVVRLRDAQPLAFPTRFDDALDHNTCALPGCDLRFVLDSFTRRPQLHVYELIVSRVYPIENVHECEWKAQDYHGIFIRQGGDADMTLWEGAAGFAGLFYDPRGVRALMTHEDGTLKLASPPQRPGGTPTTTFEHTWYIPHEEDRVVRSLAPYCGP